MTKNRSNTAIPTWVLTQVSKDIGEKDSLFNKLFLGNWISKYKRMKLNPSLSPCIKIQFKMDHRSQDKTAKVTKNLKLDSLETQGKIKHYWSKKKSIKRVTSHDILW